MSFSASRAVQAVSTPRAAYAIDVDGTLIGRDGVPPGAWRALRASRARGASIGLCTGRLLAGATEDLARRVHPEGIHVSQSGAVVSDSDGRAVWASHLSADAVTFLIRAAAELPMDLELYWSNGFGAFELTRAVRVHADHLGVQAAVITADDLPSTVTSAVCLVRCEHWQQVRPVLGQFPDLQVSPATTPWAPDLVFANLTAVGVSKGSALAILADHLALSLDRVAMVGDGENDLDAMYAAGIAVAMGSAPSTVRSVADLVVPSAEEDGLAVALSHLDTMLLST